MNSYLFQLDNVDVLMSAMPTDSTDGIKFYPTVKNTLKGGNSVNVSIDPVICTLYYRNM